MLQCVLEGHREDGPAFDLVHFYEDLWVALEIAPDRLEDAVLDATRPTEDMEMAFSILFRLARRTGTSGPAQDLLRRWVLSGKRGWTVLVRLCLSRPALDFIADTLGGFLAAVPDDGDLRGLLRAEGGPRAWFEKGGRLHHPRLWDAWRAVRKERRKPPPLPRDLSRVPHDLLLGRLHPAGGDWNRIQGEIRRRRDPTDRDAFLRLAIEEGDPLVRAEAFRVLRGHRIPGAFEAADAVQDLPGSPDAAYLARMAGYYMDSLPAESTIPWARRWVCSTHLRRRWAAGWTLARHATAAEFDVLARAVGAGLAEDPARPLRHEAEALGRTGEAAARPLLVRIFRECPGTGSRNAAARALATLPGGLPAELALEGLWDAAYGVRSASIAAVPLDLPGAREGLRRIAAGTRELDEELRAAARARLGVVPASRDAPPPEAARR